MKTRNASANKAKVSKTIRLTPEEAEEFSKICQEEPFTESALMKRLVLEGLTRYKLEKAIAAYTRREISIGEGAAMAGISYNRFEKELWDRHIMVLKDPQFLQTLASLGESFEQPQLFQAIRTVKEAGVEIDEEEKGRGKG